jgi:hypothetical protein
MRTRNFFHRHHPDASGAFILITLAIGACFAAIMTVATITMSAAP